MRILLVILQYPPDVNSTGLLFEQIATRLIAEGHHVTVLTSFPHYQDFRIRPEDRGKRREWGEWKGARVLRHWVYTGGSKGRLIHRLLNYLSFNAAVSWSAWTLTDDFDLVFCTNGSFFSGLSGWFAGRVHGAPVVYNVQDLYPDVPIQTGQLPDGFLAGVLRRIEALIYSAADHVSVITPSFRENLLAKGVPARKVTVIPNFVDTEFIRPLPRSNNLSRSLGLEGRFVVMHAGNVGYVYDLPALLEAAAMLRDHPQILFVIVGDGAAKAGLEQRAHDLGLDNVAFLPFQPHAELPWLRAASDVQVALYQKGAGANSMPSKVYEVMASERPLLVSAEADTDVRRLVERVGCGVCVDPEDPAALAAAVRRLASDPDACARMGRRGREEADSKYSVAAAAGAYARLFASLSGRSAHRVSERRSTLHAGH